MDSLDYELYHVGDSRDKNVNTSGGGSSALLDDRDNFMDSQASQASHANKQTSKQASKQGWSWRRVRSFRGYFWEGEP
ncbi:MAG: hypothetical protein LBJ64_08245 [Deltaproteobacteria bacterium]|jgi:hypothetical protein|nr:hypothetical protein [Deltaproteobacteria bacterium]